MNEDKHREIDFDEDPFTRMMFGSRTKNTENKVEQNASLDIDELMANIDALVESARNLKPLFKKFYPIIEQLWKKE